MPALRPPNFRLAVLDRSYGRDLNWLAELRQIADYGELRNVSIVNAERLNCECGTVR